jgi:hypothetical protein
MDARQILPSVAPKNREVTPMPDPELVSTLLPLLYPFSKEMPKHTSAMALAHLNSGSFKKEEMKS